MTEKDLHKQICTYLKFQYPFTLFTTDCSGMKMTIGQAVQLKKLRSSNGFPDIFILHKSVQYCGLFLEVKKDISEVHTKDGKYRNVSHIQEQLEIINKLKKQGYWASFVWSFESAKLLIDSYMCNSL